MRSGSHRSRLFSVSAARGSTLAFHFPFFVEGVGLRSVLPHFVTNRFAEMRRGERARVLARSLGDLSILAHAEKKTSLTSQSRQHACGSRYATTYNM